MGRRKKDSICEKFFVSLNGSKYSKNSDAKMNLKTNHLSC